MEVSKISFPQDHHKSGSRRDLNFDFLKAIGILSIILAHTLSKDETLIYQLRNFDVPLMVMVSGALFWQTAGQKSYSLFAYLLKRCYRLLLPTWSFLLFFFIASYFIARLQGLAYPFSAKEIFYSFTLLIGGIGYVWIIRVFLLMAVIAPFLLRLRMALKKNSFFGLAIIAVYLIYEVMLVLLAQIPATEVKNLAEFLFQRVLMSLLVSQILVLLIPYGCLFAFGIMMTQVKEKVLIVLMIIFGAIFTSLAIAYASDAGGFVLTQSYKYPPRLYYLSYSIFASLLLYLISNHLFKFSNKINLLPNLNLKKAIIFLSSSSLSIYLWHVFVLYYWRVLFRYLGIKQNLIPQFFIVAALAIAIVFCQSLILSTIPLKINFNKSKN